MINIFPWFAIVFALLDVGLSVAMLLLFVYPLWNNARALARGLDMHVSKHVMDVAWKNAKLTAFALSVTVTACIFLGIAHLTASADPEQNESLLIWSLVAVHCDLACCGLIAKSMTFIWLPLKWRKLTSHDSSSHESSKAMVSPMTDKFASSPQIGSSISATMSSPGRGGMGHHEPLE
jgi:hypothetical protein